MILDILYIDGRWAPEQIQGVRMFTFYAEADGPAQPELVIHFQVICQPRHIPIANVKTFMVTND